MTIRDDIMKYAIAIDIDEIGFASMEPFFVDEQILKERRLTGNYTEFEEADIKLRINPKESFEFGKSIIVVTESYGRPFDNVDENSGRGRFSISAYGIDYHKILKDKMNRLGEFIEKEYGINYCVQVDTGPLMERSLAVRAGLGWIGKNTCFYSNKFGSFVFIGCIVIDIDLSSSIEPGFISNCGDCNKCVDNCPTKALSPYILNIENCISYNTVTKNNFNFDIGKYLNSSLYGCDICQMSCPKNKISNFKIKDYFDIESEISNPKLEDILNLSNSQYKKIYGKSAIFWRGNTILKRNAILALLNSEDEEYILNLLEENFQKLNDYLKYYILYAYRTIEEKNSKSSG